MGTEVIMLAKKFDVKKVQFPAVITEKLDGVAADFYSPAGKLRPTEVRSRQDKPILSVQHIQRWFDNRLKPGSHAICELYIPGMRFKDIGGLVRAHEPAPQLQAFIYDFYEEGKEDMEYADRVASMVLQVGKAAFSDPESPVHIIPGKKVNTIEELNLFMKVFTIANPTAEGMVIRAMRGKDSVYKMGRSWGMLKHKTQATADLRVVKFEEAVSEKKQPLGMVGRIWVEFDTPDGKRRTGAGAGYMTHAERREVFLNQKEYIGRIAEIAYMPDPSYLGGFREPRFHQWRDDKTEPSQE